MEQKYVCGARRAIRTACQSNFSSLTSAVEAPPESRRMYRRT